MSIVQDEVELLAALVPLQGAVLLELGCGNAEFSRRLARATPVAAIAALEVDRVQHERNLAGVQEPKISFGYGGAEAIPFADASFDGVLMMKSLHHVPMERLDDALREVRRVLRPGGWAYISEPVYAGPLNEITRLFHDEGRVRAAAYEALKRARASGVLEEVEERTFDMPARYESYDDFVRRHVQVTHSEIGYTEEIAAQVRGRLEAYMTPAGARFMRPMRVNLMRRP